MNGLSRAANQRKPPSSDVTLAGIMCAMSSAATAVEAAIQRHEGFLRLDPDNAPLRITLADLYHRAGRVDDAALSLQKVLDREPSHAVARGRLASLLLTQHRFVEAEQALRELLPTAPYDRALQHNLGLALYQQRRWHEALDAFQAAAAMAPDGAPDAATAPATLGYLTRTLHHLGRTAEAIDIGQRWLKSGDPQAGGLLSLIEMDHGRLEDARRLAAEVLARRPDDVDAHVVLGMGATERLDMTSAAGHFEQVLQHRPDEGRGWFGLGLVRLHERNHEEAVRMLIEASRRMPDHAPTLSTLGWAHLVARNFPESERCFRAAVAADPRFAEGHGGLGLVLVHQGRREEARGPTRRALRLNPNCFGAAYAKGSLMALDGKREAGELVVAEALQRPLLPDGTSLLQLMQPMLRDWAARQPQPTAPDAATQPPALAAPTATNPPEDPH